MVPLRTSLLSEQQQLTQGGPRGTPIIDMIRTRASVWIQKPGAGGTQAPTGSSQTQAGAAQGPQGPVMTILSRFRAKPGQQEAYQLTGSQDFIIGVGVGVLVVALIGALTFEIWAPKVAARIARSAGKGLIGGLGGTAGKGLLGLGLLPELGIMGGRPGTQLLGASQGLLGAGQGLRKLGANGPLKRLRGI